MLLEYFYVYTILVSALGVIEAKTPYHPKAFKSCFEELGCISTNDLWFDEVKRPVNLEPLDRFTIRTSFILFKKNESNQLIYDVMTAKASTIETAGFVKDCLVIFLIHDFTANGFTGWIKHFARVALKETSNVVSVDWESGAEPPYAQAVANARVVALELIDLIKTLQDSFGVSADKIQIVGHGVGAHIAGYVGCAISGIQKITGLDPSGPFFEGMPKEVKLDSSDAKFVEVVHTDAFGTKSQGTQERMGHVDFYANNAGVQPGCDVVKDFPAAAKLDRNILKEGEILPDCSHKRAFKYYIEALEKPECKFLGIPCNDHKKFAEGRCITCGDNPKCIYLAADSKVVASSSKLFFNTRDRSPFCMFSYVVDITINERSKEQTGRFEMMLIGDNDKVSNATSASGMNVMKYEAGKTYSQVFYASPFKILNIQEAEVKWVHKKTTFCLVFCDNGIQVSEVLVKLLTKTGTCKQSRLCPTKADAKISSGSYTKFVKC